eukprot:TRINITY_DN1783_c0_g1_i1.p1 TRINITY_DN1783_c0_g1~~TRINITY_DN1783_c0_g1_i1.p1  ORF type:complete len:569 (-),score=27.51 TRINITY_DN1783_c0_g1_i1:338-2044(-)
MGTFPEQVTVKIVKLALRNRSNIKAMRLVCKSIKAVVDEQVTITPVTIYSQHLPAALRKFPKINTLNLKQTVLLDDLVHSEDDLGTKVKEIEQEEEEYHNIEKQQAVVEPVEQFQSLISLQLSHIYDQPMDVSKVIGVLSNQVSNLEIEFVIKYDLKGMEDHFLSQLQSLIQLSNLQTLTLDMKYYDRTQDISVIAELTQLEELRIFGSLNYYPIKGLTNLTNLRKMHFQDCFVNTWKHWDDWEEFFSHFQSLDSFVVFDCFFAWADTLWDALEVLLQFPKVQTVGITLKHAKEYNPVIHQHRIDVLAQTCEIKSQLQVQLEVDTDCDVFLDFFRVMPSTCIQSINFSGHHEGICEYLRSSDLLNLQELQLEYDCHITSIQHIFDLHNLHRLCQLTKVECNFNQQNDDGMYYISKLPNLKYLDIYYFDETLNARNLQDLSRLCANGTLQDLVIETVYFDTAFVDSICVPGCNLRKIFVHVKEKNIQEYMYIVEYMFDKFDSVLSRIPYVFLEVDIFVGQKYKTLQPHANRIATCKVLSQATHQEIQQERRKRLYSKVQSETFQVVEQD